ncbi:hypothetical protein [Chitinophaga cymbidii]|uniref:Uncharacterized protein n=1 Tax=Chitinophaga cymbidii TaxID=1096750 RepID=A0A512RQ06_9BACT|nr:hypothetical protein [Chitinophaga cymbidii]GEP97775.1 hypothetical protein CCY01nite_40350 [Chitinophaga cymbidii]
MQQRRNSLKVLEQLKQENIFLKQRLASALKLDTTKTFLERAEYLQLQFLQNDQALALLHHDLVMLYQQNKPNKIQMEGLELDLEKMQQEIEHMKILCSDLPEL